MKRIRILLTMGLLLVATTALVAQDYKGNLDVVNREFKERNDTLFVSFEFRVHADMIKSCQTMLLFPEVETDRQSLRFPYLQLNGLNRGHMIHRSERLRKTDRGREKPYMLMDINSRTDSLIQCDFQAPYEMWMDTARLVLKEEIWDCAGEKRLYTYSLNRRVELTVPQYPPAAFRVYYVTPKPETKQRTLHMKSYLHFHVNQFVIIPDLRNNRAELAKIRTEMGDVRNNPDITIRHIDIIGYASPEGSYASNDRLSYNRANALKSYIQQEFNLPERILQVSNTPEDWDGLREAVEKSELAQKAQILAIIDSYDDYDRKDARLTAMGAVYQTLLRDFYPPLRRVECEVDYTIRDYTLKEAQELAFTEPELLSHYELYQVAQLYETSSPEYKKLLELILRQYPDDPIACNNYAALLLELNEPEVARHYLDKIDSPIEYNNRGVYHLMRDEYEEAETFFRKAVESGVEEAIENRKVLEQKKTEEETMQRYRNR